MAGKSQQLFGVTFNIGLVAKILTITNPIFFGTPCIYQLFNDEKYQNLFTKYWNNSTSSSV